MPEQATSVHTRARFKKEGGLDGIAATLAAFHMSKSKSCNGKVTPRASSIRLSVKCFKSAR